MDRPAAVTPPAEFVGLDMGTTNTRAWRVEGGRIAARAHAAVGIRDAAVAGTDEVLRSTLADLVRQLASPAHLGGPAVAVAAGMITSEQGLCAVPHVPAPAGVEELAAGARWLRLAAGDGVDLLLVPGVRTGPPRVAPGSIAEADVMRGEEMLFVGLAGQGKLRPGEVVLNLGSHWKVVEGDAGGRIVGSRTFLTGELLHAAQTRTVLAASVPHGRPEELDLAWARMGADEARRSGLDRALFCVRLLDQRAESTAQERMAFLAGVVAGAVLPDLLRHVGAEREVVITGGGGVAPVVRDLLEAAGRRVRILDGDAVEAATVAGLATIAAAVGRAGPPRR